MKKNKLYTFFLVFSSLYLFSSCLNSLDVIPEGQHSYDEIFANEVTTGAYLNSCYEDIPGFAVQYSWGTNLPIILTDDAWEYTTNTNYVGVAYKGMKSDKWSNKLIADNNNWGKGNRTSWDLFFRNIRRCNLFISRIDNAVVPTEQDRAHWKAEARVLRAYYYWELISRFGGVPIIKDVLPVDYDGADLRRESFKTCADFIISECEEAMKVPEFPWRYEKAGEEIRMTKAIAAMVKSRTALYMASPLFCDGQNYWADAERITKESLDACLANGYELYTEVRNTNLYGDNAFYEYSTSQADYGPSPIDKETIWIAKFKMGGNASIKFNGLPSNGASKSGICPTQELVDAFPMKDGTYVLDLKEPYKDELHLEPNYASGTTYNPQKPYENRDPRFYAIIFYNGSQTMNKNQKMFDIWTYNGAKDGIKMGDIKRTCTGYYMRKYMRPDSYPGSWLKIHWRMMRLSELYLNYAEAAIENGNWQDAVDAIKPIRDRVKMKNINPSNQEEARLMVQNERRIEMAMEECRYNDIRRWTKPGEEMKYGGKHLTAMWIEKVGNTYEYHRCPIGQSYDKKTGSFVGTPWTRETYKSKYLLHGLELDEANRLEAVTGVNWQNPGWD